MIRGERVTLRQWTDADLAPFAAMNDDPEVMRHMRSQLTREESDALVARVRGQIDAQGFGLWAIDVPVLGFAGFVGVAKVPFEVPATVRFRPLHSRRPPISGSGFPSSSARHPRSTSCSHPPATPPMSC